MSLRAFVATLIERIQSRVIAPPQPLPTEKHELEMIRDNVDRSLTLIGRFIGNFNRIISTADLVQVAESVKDVEWSKHLKSALSTVIESVGSEIIASGEHPIGPSIECYFSNERYAEHSQAVCRMLTEADRLMTLSDDLNSALVGEAFAPSIQGYINRIFGLASELAKYRRGETQLAPIIPEQDREAVEHHADKYNQPESTEVDDDEDYFDDEEDDPPTSQEIKSEMLQRGHEILAACEQGYRTLMAFRRELTTAIESSRRSRRPKGDINLRMLQAIQEDRSLLNLSVEQWKIRLNCSKSTIQKTKTWAIIMKLREGEKLDRIERQSEE